MYRMSSCASWVDIRATWCILKEKLLSETRDRRKEPANTTRTADMVVTRESASTSQILRHKILRHLARSVALCRSELRLAKRRRNGWFRTMTRMIPDQWRVGGIWKRGGETSGGFYKLRRNICGALTLFCVINISWQFCALWPSRSLLLSRVSERCFFLDLRPLLSFFKE